MLKKFIRKTIGTFTVLSIIGVSLVATPTAAQATEPNNEPLDVPTNITLELTSTDPTSATIKATVDKPLENSSSIISLYKEGDPLTQQTADEGTEVLFTVSRPLNNAPYEEYYAVVNNLTSNRITVYSPNITWGTNISTSLQNNEFSTNNSYIPLTWSTNQTLTNTGKSLYILQKDTEQIVYRTNEGSQGEAQVPLPPALVDVQEYYTLVADSSNAATNRQELTNLIAGSGYKQVQRKPWAIELATDKPIFSTDDDSPLLTWTTNQPLPPITESELAVYIWDRNTGEIVAINNNTTTTTTSSTPIRFYTEKTKTFAAIIAAYDSSNIPTNKNQLVDIKTISNDTTIQQKPWEVTATISQQDFSTDGPTPKIYWETNQSINGSQGNYSLFFVDLTTKTIIGQENQTSSLTGEFEVPRFYNGPAKEYRVYVARSNVDPSHLIYYSDYETASSTISTSRVAWQVTADTDNPTYTTTGEEPTINWVANQSLTGTNGAYRAYLVDLTSHEIVDEGVETSNGNPANSGQFKIKKYTGPARSYAVYIAASDYENPTSEYYLKDIQAISNSVATQRAPWTVEVQIDTSSYLSQDADPVITWTTNQVVTEESGYEVFIADESGQIYYRSTDYDLVDVTTGSVTVSKNVFTDTSQKYYAIVASTQGYRNNAGLLHDVQATSALVQTQRTPWTLNVSIDKTVYSTDDSAPTITWETNHSIEATNYKYMVYLAEEETGRIVNWSLLGDATSGSFQVGYSSGGPFTYRLYVAKGGGANYDPFWHWPGYVDSLQDVVAVSETLTTQRAVWNITLTEVKTEVVYPNAGIVEHTFKWETNQTNIKGPYDVYIFSENGEYKINRSIYNYPYNDPDNWVGKSGEGTILTFGEDINYYAYVAEAERNREYISHPSQLRDVQAVSNVVNVAETSREVLSQAQKGGGNPSEGDCNQQCYGDPVNSYNGEFFENETDLTLSTKIPFNFSRSYSTSSLNQTGAFGAGWTFNYDMKLTGNESTLKTSKKLTLKQENGSIVNFSKAISNGQEIYASPTNVLANMTYDEITDSFLFTRRNNITYVFNATTGELTQIKDLNNNYINFSYTNDKLTQVVSNENKTLSISWIGNKIAAVSDGTQTVAYNYSTSGNVEIVNLPNVVGNKQYIYDSENRVTGIVHPNGGAYHNVYNNDGQVVEQTDPLNQTTFFEYENNTTTITLPDGTVNKEIYNALGQLVERKMAVGSNVETSYTYTYGSSRQVTGEYGPSGLIVSHTYDYYGNVLSSTNALNQTYTYTYNNLNQVEETTNPLGKKAHNVYDEKGNLIEAETFNGNVSKYEVDAAGRTTAIIAPNDLEANNGKKNLITYDTSGFMNSMTQPDGGSVNFVNNQLGSPLSVTNALNQTITYTYNTENQLVETQAPNGAIVKTEYDNGGKVISETDVLGNETVYSYDLLNRQTSVTTVLGTVEYEYDSLGRLIKQINADDTEIQYAYDALGRNISITDANGGVTTKTYYANSLLKDSTDALGNVTKYEYDANGNVVKVTDALNNVTTSTYDNLNRLTSSTTSNGYTESYVYDDDGRIIQKTKAGIETTQYEYDSNGNLVKTIYPDSSTEEREYNSNNSLITVKDRDGKVTANEYNLGGQLVKTVRPDLTEAEYSYTNGGKLHSISYDNWLTVDTEYVYDIAGRVTSEFKNGVETVYSYDAASNMTRRGPPVGAGVEYEYNSYGQLTNLTYPSGVELGYSYDNNGNLLQVNKGTETLAAYEYDANNNNFQTTYGNGTVENKTFDVLNRLKEIQVTDSSNMLYKKTLELNNVGFIIGQQTSSANNNIEEKTYSYGDTQRLENATDVVNNQSNSYSFDSSSNLLSSANGTNTFSSNGQLASTIFNGSVNTYSYDLRGNRTKTVTLDNNSNISSEINYEWSSDNKLVGYDSVAGDNSLELSYAYDAKGLLQTKERNKNGVSSSDSFVWNAALNVPTVLEDDSNVYLYGIDSTPFAQMPKNGSGDVEYLYSDERGSIVAAADGSGELSWLRTYDEYGSSVNETLVGSSSNRIVTPFAYAGEYLDSDTGLYNLRARWYEPFTASFISVDPKVLTTGEGYSYGSANPLFYTDPLGLESLPWLDAVAGAIDGFLGVPGASTLANWIAPGSVNTCSVTYIVGNAVGTVASFFVPGGPILKGISFAVTGAIKIASTINKFDKIAAAVATVSSVVVRSGNKIEGVVNTVKSKVGIAISKSENHFMDRVKAGKEIYDNFKSGLDAVGKYNEVNQDLNGTQEHPEIYMFAIVATTFVTGSTVQKYGGTWNLSSMTQTFGIAANIIPNSSGAGGLFG